ncbi:glycosyltransferase family 61 protein [Synechococcus sp. CBW1006]|nr:glycosyltransferase family 61 protein [Synechococcus sp. CBW1006]
MGETWLQWRWYRIVDGYRPCHGPRRRKRGRLKDLAQLRHPAQRIDEALWVHDDWSGNYFHWLTDVLPKLQAWQESGASCRTVLLPQALLNRHYVRDSLQILGFRPIAWTSLRLEISRLIVISTTAPTGNYRKHLLQRLQRRLLAPSSAPKMRKIYVSRGDASKRFLLNEADLIPLLQCHGIEFVTLQGLSLREQIEMFSHCTLLVGLHGAGLANMLYMPSGSDVVEIRRDQDCIGNCYFSMASALLIR